MQSAYSLAHADWTPQMDTTTLIQNGPMNNGNDKVFQTPKSPEQSQKMCAE